MRRAAAGAGGGEDEPRSARCARGRRGCGRAWRRLGAAVRTWLGGGPTAAAVSAGGAVGSCRRAGSGEVRRRGVSA